MHNIDVNNKVNRNIVSFTIFLYFISILLLFLVENSTYRTLPYHIISVVCVIEYFFPRVAHGKIWLNKNVLMFVVLCAVTGVLNHLMIRNTSYFNIIECSIFNTFIACLLIEEKIDKRWIEYAAYAYAAVFVYRIIQLGLFVRITRFSNNQVSVALLIPIITYYILSDLKDENPSLLPALVGWILSLLARGRSGIVTFTFLFLIVFVFYYRNTLQLGRMNKIKTLLILVGRIFLILGVAVTGYLLYARYSDVLLVKFFSKGIDNSTRIVLWKEYFKYMWSNLKYLLLGVPKKLLLIGTMFQNNTHNSFISIHANNGIVMLLFTISLIIKSIKLSIKNNKILYLLCTLIFCFRSFFDNVFWGTWGTTTFIYILFIPLLMPTLSEQDVR